MGRVVLTLAVRTTKEAPAEGVLVVLLGVVAPMGAVGFSKLVLLAAEIPAVGTALFEISDTLDEALLPLTASSCAASDAATDTCVVAVLAARVVEAPTRATDSATVLLLRLVI